MYLLSEFKKENLSNKDKAAMGLIGGGSLLYPASIYASNRNRKNIKRVESDVNKLVDKNIEIQKKNQSIQDSLDSLESSKSENNQAYLRKKDKVLLDDKISSQQKQNILKEDYDFLQRLAQDRDEDIQKNLKRRAKLNAKSSSVNDRLKNLNKVYKKLKGNKSKLGKITLGAAALGLTGAGLGLLPEKDKPKRPYKKKDWAFWNNK